MKDINKELLEAVENGDMAKVQSCLNKGVDVKKLTDSPLIIAAENDHTDIVRLLLENGADVNVESPFGSALDRAGWNIHINRVLLDFGANPNSPNSKLIMAAENGRKQIVKLLLKYGADVNTKKNSYHNNGETALHRAVAAGKLDIVKILVEHGADVCARDNRGLMPIQVDYYCNKRTYLEIVDYLVEHGAKRYGSTKNTIGKIKVNIDKEYFVKEKMTVELDLNNIQNKEDLLVLTGKKKVSSSKFEKIVQKYNPTTISLSSSKINFALNVQRLSSTKLDTMMQSSLELLDDLVGVIELKINGSGSNYKYTDGEIDGTARFNVYKTDIEQFLDIKNYMSNNKYILSEEECYKFLYEFYDAPEKELDNEQMINFDRGNESKLLYWIEKQKGIRYSNITSYNKYSQIILYWEIKYLAF